MIENDNELDEILESIRNRKRPQEPQERTEAELEPPKPLSKRISDPMPVIEPPAAPVREQAAIPSVSPAEPEPEKRKAKKRKGSDKKSRPSKKEGRAKKEKSKKKGEPSAYGFNHKIAIALVLIIAAAIGINQAVVYSQVGYLRPYEEEYGIEFPRGIKEEFCDAYGSNPNIIGKLIIEDTDSEIMLCDTFNFSTAYTESGLGLDNEHQFDAIFMNSSAADIESVYAKAKDFEKSSQKIVYRNIYGKERIYQVFASYYVTTDKKDDNGYLFPYNICGALEPKDFDNFRDKIETRSLFKTPYKMSYLDKYLTISVDSDFMDNFRFVIICVRTDKVEPVTKTEPNPKIHYPQIWYDRHYEHNPYWIASDWYPDVTI